jgi:hypothetical protein
MFRFLASDDHDDVAKIVALARAKQCRPNETLHPTRRHDSYPRVCSSPMPPGR